MIPFLRIFLPLLVILLAAGGAFVLTKLEKPPEKQEREERLTAVDVAFVETKPVTFSIRTQGTVEPRTETSLVPEVAGKIVSVSPLFYAGGLFEQGELLVQIDPSDYETALADAEALLAQRQLAYEQEQARAEQARKDWESLGRGEPSALTLREPQVAQAKALLTSAQAGVERARRNLDRTEIRAPYAGMVRARQADLGQYVTPGTPIGRIFATDYVEIRLPLASSDLPYVTLPGAYRGESALRDDLPQVVLRDTFQPGVEPWIGQIVRTEGTIDPSTRVLYAVARVPDPYGLRTTAEGSSRVPLQVGTFVEAEIAGRSYEEVVSLPRYAVRNGSEVLVIDEEGRLVRREVEILRLEEQDAYLSSGLEAGEMISLTALEFIVEGMKVKPLLDGQPVDAEGELMAEGEPEAAVAAEPDSREPIPAEG